MHPLVQRLEENLRPLLHDSKRLCLGYSGGLDSHVLLHSLTQLRDANRIALPLHVYHVNHGLSQAAAQWAEHCAAVCNALKLPIQIIKIDARAAKGESPEAKAREARYAALQSRVQQGDMWLTAHHQDDQAETLLLQLLRGAGVAGLSSMAAVQPFAAARIARPMLNITRQAIHEYAAQMGLRWVEDESNQRTDFDRNFLRHEVMPILHRRWPSAAKTIARSAEHCAAATRLLTTEAKSLLVTAQINSANSLSVAGLQRLDADQQSLLLRHWIHEQGFPVPAEAHIRQIQTSVLEAKIDAAPVVHWRDTEIRRYRDALFILPPLSKQGVPQWLNWSLEAALDLDGAGRLELLPAARGQGLSLPRVRASGPVQVRFRQGGERCRPHGRNTHSLKKLMQEWAIPPWQRDRVPLLFAAEQLIAVAGFAVCEGFQARAEELGYRLHWCPAQGPMVNSPPNLATDSDCHRP